MATFRDDYWPRAIRLNRARAEDSDALTAERLAQAREKLTPADLAEEHEVLQSAHLPYRYMSSWERTELFWRTYKSMYKRFRGRRAPKAIEDHRNDLEALDNKTFVALYRARQRADAIGMPYTQYIGYVMRRYEERGSAHVPAPNQLLSDDLLPGLIETHEAQRKDPSAALFPTNFDPRFYAMNYVGDPVQLMALEAITSEINSAGPARKANLLARHLNVDKTISESEAVTRFGAELVEDAKSIRGGFTSAIPVQLNDLEPSPPGCYGALQSASPTCIQCPFRSQCAAVHEASDAILMARFGTVDVRGQRRREQARDRKRAQRLREKEGRTMTDQEQKRILKEAGDPKAKKKRENAKLRRDKKKQASSSEA